MLRLTVPNTLLFLVAALQQLAKWAELNVLISMGCWCYWPKSNKHNDPVEKKKKLYHGKFVFKQKPSANGMPPHKKVRYVTLIPSSFRN